MATKTASRNRMVYGPRNIGSDTSVSAALTGYEYQIDVSVWLALDLILATRVCHEVELEPASQEDLEATLLDNEPGRVTSTVSMEQHRLVVQAKLRSGDPWSIKDLDRLLQHGGPRRETAASRLSNPALRYLLITNADLNGVARKLKVGHVDAWSTVTNMPRSMAKHLPNDAAGRVAVLANLDEEKLESRIAQLLTVRFRVPNAKWILCLKAFRDEARIRILGGGGGLWRRDELEQVIRSYDGSPASVPELDRYVYPTNWKSVRKSISDHHAVLIVGQSGTGKTMATRKLYEDLREEIPGLSRVHITKGPTQLTNDHTAPPVLYDIEDPWGRFSFDPQSRPWNDQLGLFLAGARHDRLMIVTTRRDVGQTAGALDSVRHWVVPLEAEHYGPTERQRLYISRIDQLPRDLHEVARIGKNRVLEALHTPLEIQKFFDALPFVEDSHRDNPPAFLSEAIRLAHQESIERTVIEQIEQRQEIRPAAILWSLLKTTDKLSLTALRIIENEMVDHDPTLGEGVNPLLNFLIAARNLRQEENTIAYYHPRVEAGIERALEKHPQIVRRTLRLLINQLALSEALEGDWGVETASRIILSLGSLGQPLPSPASNAQGRIDNWLSVALLRDGEQFQEYLRIAKAAGSANSNVSEVARYLLNRPDKSFGGLHMWGPLERDDTWYTRLREDPATTVIIKRYLEDYLPLRGDHLPPSFAAETARIVPDSTEVFLAAAMRFVGLGVHFSADAIVSGALNDLDGFEAVVDRAVHVLSPTKEEQIKSKETRLAIINREYSDEYAEFLSENDDGYTAQNFLRDFVKRMVAERGWQCIANHRHAAKLLPYWLTDLRDRAARSAADANEVATAHQLSTSTPHEEECWEILRLTWNPALSEALRERVRTGHEDRGIRRSALHCLLTHLSSDFAHIARTQLQEQQLSPLIEIAIDLAHFQTQRGSIAEEDADIFEKAHAALPAVVRNVSDAEMLMLQSKDPVLCQEALGLVANARDCSVDVRRFRVQLDSIVPLPIENDVRWLLTYATSEDIALHAVHAAVRRDMKKDVRRSLGHQYARVGVVALRALSQELAPPLPDHILELSTSTSSLVREALVDILAEKPSDYHIPTLMHLANDTWTDGYQYYGDNDMFPIARAAVEVLATFINFTNEQLETLYGIAIQTSDLDLLSNIFSLLVRSGGTAIQNKLLDMALNPGRFQLRRAAALSLMYEGEKVSTSVASRVTSDHLAKRPPTIAASLTVLLGARAAIQQVKDTAESLSINSKRRVLLLLLIRLLTDRDHDAAQGVANMLPASHPGALWALTSDDEHFFDDILDDLGEPIICAQVLSFLRPPRLQTN